MQNKYVVGLLALAFAGTHVKAAETVNKAPAKMEQSAKANREKLPETDLKQVDELEHVLQSTYEYNDQQVELGSTED